MNPNGQNAKKGKVYSLSGQLTIGPSRISTQNISNWVMAVNAARDPNMPRRTLLLQLIDSILLDGHLEAVIDKRKKAITNQMLHWETKNESNKEIIQKEILHTPWFYDLIDYAMDVVAFGHSLIELIPEKGKISKVNLCDRKNVIPEMGFLLYNFYNLPAKNINGQWDDGKRLPDNMGVYYRDNPDYSKFMIEVGKPKEYGKLMTAAQYVIYKRGAFGSWSQFAEIFGMPFRVGKYNPYDPSTRTKLEMGLDQMGAAAYAIIPDGTSIEFKDANSSGKSEVFKDLRTACNEELSTLFLGNTLTTSAGDKGARSLGEVHQSVENDINISDMIRIQYLMNWDLKRKLQAIGYPLEEDGKFTFPEAGAMSLTERIKIDVELTKVIDMSPEYFYTTYGVDKPRDGEMPIRANLVVPHVNKVDEMKPDESKSDIEETDKEEKKGTEKKKIKLHSKLSVLYNHCLTDHKDLLQLSSKTMQKSLDRIWKGLTKEIHTGKLVAGTIDPELLKWTAKELLSGVIKGYHSKLSEAVEGTPADIEMMAALEANVQVFSGFKTYHTLREATDLLKDSTGELKSFAAFREDILSINEKYNITYLQAEYQQAVAASSACSQWQDIEKAKDIFPTLTFRTAGDERVRHSHAILDGMTDTVDGPTWNTMMPPLDWGCRCDVEQGNEPITNEQISNLPKLKNSFAVNWGKEKVVFPETHPYFEVDKQTKETIKKQVDDVK